MVLYMYYWYDIPLVNVFGINRNFQRNAESQIVAMRNSVMFWIYLIRTVREWFRCYAPQLSHKLLCEFRQHVSTVYRKDMLMERQVEIWQTSIQLYGTILHIVNDAINWRMIIVHKAKRRNAMYPRQVYRHTRDGLSRERLIVPDGIALHTRITMRVLYMFRCVVSEPTHGSCGWGMSTSSWGRTW